MDRIRAKIRELLELVAAEQDCSIGIVLAEDDDDGDTAYSFFIKGYPEDVAVGADGLSAVAEGEQRKLNNILESRSCSRTMRTTKIMTTKRTTKTNPCAA